MSRIVDEHRQYLSDVPRVSAYQRAIGEIVQPGHTVVDLASGTGIMGLLACRAGAARVYSIEMSGIAGLARDIASDNGFGDRIQLIRGLSTRVDIPEKVDVIVSDQMGRFGFEAGIVEYFHDAARRFLKPAGKLIPSGVKLFCAPVSCPRIWQETQFWRSGPWGFNFRAAGEIARNTGYPVHLTAEQLLAGPAELLTLDLYSAGVGARTGAVAFTVESEGTLHGMGGWFEARLSPAASMTNSPLASERINRQNVFLPIGTPVAVKPGDRVEAKITIVPVENNVGWSVSVRSAGQDGQPALQRFVHSTLLGMLFSEEDMEKTRPSAVPRLTPWGEARRSILELMDGRRPIGEIESEVLRRHPGLFPSLKEASAFVAEVVTRYTL